MPNLRPALVNDFPGSAAFLCPYKLRTDVLINDLSTELKNSRFISSQSPGKVSGAA